MLVKEATNSFFFVIPDADRGSSPHKKGPTLSLIQAKVIFNCSNHNITPALPEIRTGSSIGIGDDKKKFLVKNTKKKFYRAYLKAFFLCVFLAIIMHCHGCIHADSIQKDSPTLWPSASSTSPWFCQKNNTIVSTKSLPHTKALTTYMRTVIRQWLRSLRTSGSSFKTTKTPSYAVRVLLAETPVDEPTTWLLQSHNGFVVYDPSLKEQSWHTAPGQLRITLHHGNLSFNDQHVLSNRIHLIPLEGHTHFDNRDYQGMFIVTQTNDTLYLINSLDLEDYICGVLRTESWPGWPLEVNKAQAIACRSYVMAKIVSSKYMNLPYHIRNTNYHQTYGGVHNNTVHRTAVEQTRGVFLAYNNEPILAMFDSCCGSIIPAHISGINFDKFPYLARTYACDFCKTCKIYTWQVDYTVHEFLQRIKKKASLNKLKSISISKKDKAGLVKEVKLKGQGKHSTCLTGKQVYSLLKEVKSFCFSISHQGDRISVKGRGFGHHCGLCQWGACQMVRNGADHKSILQYYYPGTTFMKLELFRNA